MKTRSRNRARLAPWTLAAVAAASMALSPIRVAQAQQASASSASAEEIAQARVLGNDGIKLANAGDCASAIPKLEAAERLFHALTTLVPLGECYVKEGKVVAGTEVLLRATREQAPSAGLFAAARAKAEKALPGAQARIAKLNLHVAGPAQTSVTVKVDGAPVLAAMLDSDRPTDPGSHEVAVSADGFTPVTQTVTLADGETKKTTITLEPAAPPPPSEPPPSNGATPAAEPGAPDRTLAWVSYGAGGLGLVVGTIFGILALSEHSSLSSSCPQPSACPGSEQSTISSMGAYAWTANLGFAVAILGAGAGTYFFLTAKPKTPAPTQSAFTVSPYFYGAGAGVSGRFE